ncbi:MAG: KamA family radical SAM protein [Spirochaetaceae bacterium]|nr:KamA family radical SAM protein [Spirochaetaceae bacterium]
MSSSVSGASPADELPNQISPYFADVLSRLGAAAISDEAAAACFAALNRQCTPVPAEKNVREYELDDPLGARKYLVTPRLVRQYKNRCLLLTTCHCFSYCRFCFRRNFTGKKAGFIPAAEIQKVTEWLSEHDEIQEILISGGDPLTAPNGDLENLFTELRKARPNILIRLCTRAPVFAPERFTPELLALLKRFKPLWVIPHINHPAEISERWSPESYKCLNSIIDSGIPAQSQTVLLRGINDSVPVLAELFETLVMIGIKPGYLFQGDLAKGTGHFRVPLDEGVKLYNALKKELSGLSLPVYAVDLPGGGGKVNIPATRFVRDGDNWKYTDASGKTWFYPV